MKKGIFILSFLLLNLTISFATTHIIVNSGNRFIPDNITIDAIDTVDFQLASMHNVVEVSKSTWDAEGNTPLSGGFNVAYGGGKLSGLSVGTHYYVCTPHASLGMRAIITVSSATGIQAFSAFNKNIFKVSASTSKGQVKVIYSVKEKAEVRLSLIDITGNTLNEFSYKEQLPGDYSVVIDRRLYTGTYIVRISFNDRIFTRKILIL